MTDRQTMETAMLILEEYKSITIADIDFIFKSAKKGKYGAFYDRMDGQMILGWFESHFNDRCAAAANNSMREADRFKKDLRTESFEQITDLYEKKKFR